MRHVLHGVISETDLIQCHKHRRAGLLSLMYTSHRKTAAVSGCQILIANDQTAPSAACVARYYKTYGCRLMQSKMGYVVHLASPGQRHGFGIVGIHWEQLLFEEGLPLPQRQCQPKAAYKAWHAAGSVPRVICHPQSQQAKRHTCQYSTGVVNAYPVW